MSSEVTNNLLSITCDREAIERMRWSAFVSPRRVGWGLGNSTIYLGRHIEIDIDPSGPNVNVSIRFDDKKQLSPIKFAGLILNLFRKRLRQRMVVFVFYLLFTSSRTTLSVTVERTVQEVAMQFQLCFLSCFLR